ncbi:MAG: hypothetical protein RL150_680 [Candidatus Parcubacteria bacterium]
MKQLLLFVVCACTFATPALAQLEIDEQPSYLPADVSISTTYNSQYIASRINRVITPDPTIWTQASIKWESGFYFSWLEIRGIDDVSPTLPPFEETLVTLGQSWKLDTFDFKLEATIINLDPVARWAAHDRYSFDAYISKTFTFKKNGKHSITPELRMLWFCDTQELDGGVPIIMPSVAHKWQQPFEYEHLTIQSKLGLCWDGGLYRNNTEGVFLQTDIGLQWNLAKFLGTPATLTLPGYKSLIPITHGNDGRDGVHHVFYGGIRFDF